MDELELIRRKKLLELKRKLSWPSEPLEVSEEDFEEKLSRYENVVVDFYAEWCGPCQIMAPILKALAKRLRGKVVFLKVNVDRARKLTARFNIMSVPTLLIFKKGKPVERIVGVLHPKILEKRILRRLEIETH